LNCRALGKEVQGVHPVDPGVRRDDDPASCPSLSVF
jgi:hypothetical protein